MEHEYASLSVVALTPQTTFERPPEPPELVHLDSPALEVMTDFEHVHAVRPRTPRAPIDEALECMKTKGVRMLLVLDDAENRGRRSHGQRHTRGETHQDRAGAPHAHARPSRWAR